MFEKQQIRKGMAVVDTNGLRVGTVDTMTDDEVALSSADFSDNLHHIVPMGAVQGIVEGKLVVAPGEATTQEEVEGAIDYERSTTGSAGNSPFGTSGHGTGFGGSGAH